MKHAVTLLAVLLLAACGSGDEPEPVPPEEIAAEEPAERLAVHRQWHTATFDLAGPSVAEDDPTNPFTDTLMIATFAKDGETIRVRGFFAADGAAAETGSDSGTVWRARFTPPSLGRWTYRLELREGENVAIGGEGTLIAERGGAFMVEASDREAPDFRALGRIVADGQYFRSLGNGELWIKGGANSPENLLGTEGIDGTYRMAGTDREGEAAVDTALHRFAPHESDWREGDPQFGNDQGRGLVGAMNYLADEGMNVAYFLTMNIGGDGQDVWPYRDPDDPMRFDVSRLAQWEELFAHMQARGILLHVVLQETENELMLDGGDTGPERQLYFHEMIARFGHHNGLVWNLGEENGPVHWSPEGQNTEQRMAMASFLKEHDPYGHPVLLHTLPNPEDKDDILTPLLGFADLDGLSLQVSDPLVVHGETAKWWCLAEEAGRPWILTMDEIGPWMTGAAADEDDPDHDILRRHAMWGHFLAGGAGVEWYFGAHQKGNDLDTEDLRSRANLWAQTRAALDLMDRFTEAGPIEPCSEAPSDEAVLYCGIAGGTSRILYTVDPGETLLESPQLIAFDPRTSERLCSEGTCAAGALEGDAILVSPAD